MIRTKKILIICLLMLPLVLVGYIGWNNIEKTDSEYTVNNLIVKYPTVIDLKIAVDSGALNYSKLPDEAKKALEQFIQNKDPKIIKGLK